MEPYKRDFFIARIQAGYIPVDVSGVRLSILYPDVDINLKAHELYAQAYDEALEKEMMTEDELLSFLIIQGLWSDQKEEEYQKIVPGHIEYWKIQLYESVLKSNTKKKMIKYLKIAKDEYSQLAHIRHYYDYITADGYANYVKSMYTIAECTRINNKKVKWHKYNLTQVMNAYHLAMLRVEDVRELSRTMPWSSLWPTLKAGGKIFDTNLTTEQQSLISWSTMYDRIYESPDCPSEEVIEFDDMLDGWLLVQKKKRDAEKARGEIEGAIGDKMSGAGEVFIPVETQEDATKIDLLNPQHINKIKRSRLKQVKEKGTIKQQEFKDVQQKRSMEMRQAYAKQITGR